MSLLGHEELVWPFRDPISLAGQEPAAAVHPIRAQKPVYRPTTATGISMRPSEIPKSADQVAKTARKSLGMVPVWPYNDLNRQYMPSWRCLCDLP